MNIVYCKCIVGNLYLEEINRLILIFSQKSSVVSKAQALLSRDDVTWTTRNEEACVKWIANGENVRLNIPGCLKRGKARFLFLESRLLTHFSCFYVPPSVFKNIFTSSQFFLSSPNTFFTVIWDCRCQLSWHQRLSRIQRTKPSLLVST